MKPLLTAAMLAVAPLAFGAILVWTCHERAAAAPIAIPSTSRGGVLTTPVSIHLDETQPSHPPSPIRLTNSPSVDILPKDRGFALSKPVPLEMEKPPAPDHLRPGLYQTYPYTMLLLVPGKGMDDGILGKPPDANSKMPVVNPPVRVIPKT